MRLAKLLVAAYCAAALGLEAHAVFSTTKYNNWRWPFVNYPMYSQSHGVGETITISRLRGTPCDAPAISLELAPGDLRMVNAAFERLVQQAGGLRKVTTPTEVQQAQEAIARKLQPRAGPSLCTLQVWTRSMKLGESGGEQPDAWQLRAEWKAAPARAADSAGPGPGAAR